MMSIKGISSMATRQLLAERAAVFEAASGAAVALLSIGGVDALRRVEEGEVFDFVVLAAGAIDRLEAAGRLAAGSRVDWVRSQIAVAVRAGAHRPDVSTEQGLRQAVADATRIGWSTGPSGTALPALIDKWGMTDAVAPKVVRAPPGVPVAALLVRGEVDLGFQQYSELMEAEGIDVLGRLPQEIAVVTTFSAAVCRSAMAAGAAGEFLKFLVEPSGASAVWRHGMEPV